MDLKAKNSITDRVVFTGIVVTDEEWEREGTPPARTAQAAYVGPERRNRDARDPALSLAASDTRVRATG